MAELNAKCVPPKIIHAVVRIQAAVRRLLSRQTTKSDSIFSSAVAVNPPLALALYLARRGRNGNWMDVDDETDTLGVLLASSDPLNVTSSFEFLQYCERMSLQSKRGYTILSERFWSVISRTQRRLQYLLSESEHSASELCKAIALIRSKWPASLHHYLDFAIKGAQEAMKKTEGAVLAELASCHSIGEIESLASRALLILDANNHVHGVIQRKKEIRKSSLLQEIWIMHDRPLVDGFVPILEATAFKYVTELSLDDPVYRDFIVDIGFLTVKYMRDIERGFDIRTELKTFEFCKKLGPSLVLPILKQNMTPLEFHSTVISLISTLETFDLFTDEIFRTHVTRIRRVSGIPNIRPEIADFDLGNFWDLLGDNFSLPSPRTEKPSPEIEDEPKESPVGPLKKFNRNLPFKPSSHDAYTYYNSDSLFRIPTAVPKYIVTRAL